MKAITLQPLGDAESDVLQSLCPGLEHAFGVPVGIANQSLSISRFYDEHRGQYNSSAILHSFLSHDKSGLRPGISLPDKGVCIVGITPHDLFIPILTYVFGEAALGGNVAVVSYHRFRNELYGLPMDRPLVLERVGKVAIHEIGHTLGLVHCTLQHCVMHAASYVEELDMKGHEFCPFCSSAIKRASSQVGSCQTAC